MIILIEGFDCTGKTTLSKNLLRILKFDYLKAKGPYNTKEALKFVKNNIDEYCYELKIKGIYYNLIWERCPLISHLVYGPLVDKEEVGKEIVDKFKEYQLLLYNLKTILIYCRAPVEIIRERMSEDEESKKYLKETDTELLLKKYDDLIHSDYMVLPIVEIDSCLYNKEEMTYKALLGIFKVLEEEYK